MRNAEKFYVTQENLERKIEEMGQYRSLTFVSAPDYEVLEMLLSGALADVRALIEEMVL